nr:ribbon-helix-helix protein, CopG family [Caldanaerobacter subterraneus]
MKVGETKRILVSLPQSLLEEVDVLAAMENRNRSEFIREAMKLYIRERKKAQIRESMKKGYMEMAAINSELAEMGLTAENECFAGYEMKLKKCD